MNKADARGITALGLAVGYNKVPLVKVLIDGGADVSKTDAKGSTVLHYAAGRLNSCLHFTLLSRHRFIENKAVMLHSAVHFHWSKTLVWC